MAKSKKKTVKKSKCDWKCNTDTCGSGGCAYFLGGVGAAIYYITVSTSFWMGVVGVLKALVWPLFLVMELLKFLGA